MNEGRFDLQVGLARPGRSGPFPELPFLTSPPIRDVGLLFLLLPVWWALGAEQFVWPVALGWIAARQWVILDFRMELPPVAWWLVAFLVVHLVSGAFIVENHRVITFARNLSTYVSALLLVVVISNARPNREELHRLLLQAAIGLGVGVLLGVLATSGVWRPSFRSPVGMVLPDWIGGTTYGGAISTRTFGGSAWFLLIGEYYRLTGFFLFPTFYATALVVFIPIVLFLRSHAAGTGQRVLGFLVFAGMLVNLAATTGRIAIAGALMGVAYFQVMRSPRRMPLLVAGLGFVIFALVMALTRPVALQTAAEAAAMARGAGSPASRTAVYQATLEGVLERPVFGWGTERDVPGLRYPAGSHSYYLGILYKQGIVGFLIFLALLGSVWRSTRPPFAGMKESFERRWYRTLLEYGRWVLVALLINGATDVLDLDASSMALMWLVLAVLITARSNLLRQEGLS